MADTWETGNMNPSGVRLGLGKTTDGGCTWRGRVRTLVIFPILASSSNTTTTTTHLSLKHPPISQKSISILTPCSPAWQARPRVHRPVARLTCHLASSLHLLSFFPLRRMNKQTSLHLSEDRTMHRDSTHACSCILASPDLIFTFSFPSSLIAHTRLSYP